MQIPKNIMCGTLVLLAATTTSALAQNPFTADYWNETTRRYERAYHPRYDAPPVLYYGHAPPPADPSGYGSKRPVGDGMRFRPMPLNWNDPYSPMVYRRTTDDGPAIAPYFRPGRSTYGGIRYGWW